MATAKVVFATITGNNEDIADIIAQTLEENGMDVEVEEISQADPADFEEVDLCVVCPCMFTHVYHEEARAWHGVFIYLFALIFLHFIY